MSKLFKTKVRKGNNFQNLLLQPPPCQTFRLNPSSISQADIIKSLTMSKFIPHSRSSPSPPSNQLSSHHPQSPLQNIQSQAQPPPHHHFLPNYTPFQHFRSHPEFLKTSSSSPPSTRTSSNSLHHQLFTFFVWNNLSTPSTSR